MSDTPTPAETNKARRISKADALELIYRIACNVSFDRVRFSRKGKPRITKRDEPMELIYRIAHAALGTCKGDHSDWHAEAMALKVRLDHDVP